MKIKRPVHDLLTADFLLAGFIFSYVPLAAMDCDELTIFGSAEIACGTICCPIHY